MRSKNLKLAILLVLGVAGLSLAFLTIRTPSASPLPPEPSGHYAGVWKNPGGGGLLSLNFSPYYRPGSDPEAGSPLDRETICAALDAVAPFTDTIRTFGVSGELNRLYEIAKNEYRLRVIAGCWIGAGTGEEKAREELEILADLGNRGLADILVVGSEGLFRGDYGGEDLIRWLNDLRGMLTRDVPVGTSDTAGELLRHPGVVQAADVALFTYYPWFAGVPIEDAASDFLKTYRALRDAAGQTKLICSETGWKFEGNAVGAARPGPGNAARYFGEIVELSRRENLEICYFEAVEEGWKMKYGDAGWGLLDETLTPRPSVSESLLRLGLP